MTLSERVAARYLLAEDLTYGWLLKVKKGWVSVVGREGMRADDKVTALREFLGNLAELIRLKHRGMGLRFLESESNKALDAAIRVTNGKLEAVDTQYNVLRAHAMEMQRTWQDFRDGISEDHAGKSVGWVIREMGGTEAFHQRYPEDEILADGVAGAQVAMMAYSDTPKTWAPVTAAFEKVMKVLYADAKALAEFRQVSGPGEDDALDRVFTLYGLKVIIADPQVERSQIQDYLRRLDKAYALLKAKGLTRVWYGVMFVELKNRELTPETTAAYAELGYDNLRATAGTYHSGRDAVVLSNPPSNFFTSAVIHELGHRFWFKFMRPEQRARYNSLVRTNPSKQVRDLPSGHYNDLDVDFDLGKVKASVMTMLGHLGAEVKELMDDGVLVKKGPSLVPLYERKLKALLPNLPEVPWKGAEEAISVALAALDGLSLLDEREAGSLDTQAWFDQWVDDTGVAAKMFTQFFKQMAARLEAARKPVAPVSDYGKSSIEEAFAEAFERYVGNVDMDRDQIETFRSVLASNDAAGVEDALQILIHTLLS